MFLDCAPGCIVAACQVIYIRETKHPFEDEGLSVGQAEEVCGLTIDTLRYGERAGLTLWLARARRPANGATVRGSVLADYIPRTLPPGNRGDR
jgi:hypothetical protein